MGINEAAIVGLTAAKRLAEPAEKWQCEWCGERAEGFFQKIITDILTAFFILITIAIGLIALSAAAYFFM